MPTPTGTTARPTDEMLADLIDKIVEVRMGLQPVCHEGKNSLPPDARRKVTEACEILHSVTVELVEMLRVRSDGH